MPEPCAGYEISKQQLFARYLVTKILASAELFKGKQLTSLK